MEPVTHLLTGACLARTGFHRRVAYATIAMVVSAEFPDIDTLWSLWGPVSGFEHHRGITHTFLGVPFEAALLLGLVFLWHTAKRRFSHKIYSGREPNPVPERWGALYGLILLALLSHLLLDYTNNYGLRPFFPFNDHWYAASIVFIFDPLMFVLLLFGLLLPLLFRLVGREIGARDQSMADSGWARAALAGVLVLWAVRTYEHGRAVGLAERTTLRAPETASFLEALPLDSEPGTNGGSGPAGTVPVAPAQARSLLQPVQTLASPDPLSVFRWYTAVDFGPADELGVADSRLGTFVPGRLLVKPGPTPALTAAERSRLGRIYLDWSAMPVLSVNRSENEPGGQGTVTVRFRDARFMGDTPLLHRNGTTPLIGEVILGAGGAVQAEGMDGHFGH